MVVWKAYRRAVIATTICKFDKVDDYTFTVTFQFPKPTFLEEVAINYLASQWTLMRQN
ncbi:MAG: hypothetical protein PVH64_09145 [Bacillota bacterium]|jgi:ABC-type transport system substrate-binding protein